MSITTTSGHRSLVRRTVSSPALACPTTNIWLVIDELSSSGVYYSLLRFVYGHLPLSGLARAALLDG
ncbi:hypothetical protein ACFLT5_00515 [Chloroflexota bacterium]